MGNYRRKIGIVTGTRAEYGILRPVIQAIDKQQSTCANLIVAGMHLLPDFGMTVRDIERDGYTIGSRVDMLLGSDSPAAMAKSVGLGIISMTQAIQDVHPSLIIVLGDRGEAFSAAVAAAHLKIPVAHIHGGECTTGGNIDESIRWAITRFSHIHFTATEASRDRLIMCGEDPARVFHVGAPGLDVALSTPPMAREELGLALGVDLSSKLILVVQHPVTTQSELAAVQMRETMEAVTSLGCQVMIIYPNSDAGGKEIIRVIEDYRARPEVNVFPSLPHKVFLNLMRQSAVIVGNSSSALIEAPSFAVPAVNVGIRQSGRDRGANVIDVGHDRELIAETIHRCLNDDHLTQKLALSPNPYGEGKAAMRIAETVARAVSMPEILQKGTFQTGGSSG